MYSIVYSSKWISMPDCKPGLSLLLLLFIIADVNLNRVRKAETKLSLSFLYNLRRSSLNVFVLQSLTNSFTIVFYCHKSSKIKAIEFTMCNKKHFYVKYVYVWCVFSLSLTRSVSYWYSLVYLWAYDSGI